MNCQEAMEQIILQSSRPALTPEAGNHVAGCRACAAFRREHQALWRQMDAWEAPEVSPGWDRRLFARMEGRTPERAGACGWVIRLFRPLQPSFATALACIMVIAVIIIERGGRTPAPAGAGVALHAIERDDPRQIELALDDIQMLSDFDILPVTPGGNGKS
jgi:hypothetical protein